MVNITSYEKKIKEFNSFLTLNYKFKKYEIKEDGSIFNKKTKSYIRCCKNIKGYLWVSFYFPNNTTFRFSLARFILMVFNRTPSDGEQANHKDGNKENNSIQNLEWVTSSENISHAYKTGLSRSGRWGKINDEGLIKIREEWSNGASQKELSVKYSVTQSVICRLFRDFSKDKEIDQLQKQITELKDELVRQQNFHLIESERLNKIIYELKLDKEELQHILRVNR